MFNSFSLNKMLSDHGVTLTLRKKTTEGSYDASSGSVTGSATTDYSVLAYLYNYSNGLVGNNEDIRLGQRKCLVSGNSEEPDIGDLIVGSNDSVKITKVTTIYSAGVVICYICDVRE